MPFCVRVRMLALVPGNTILMNRKRKIRMRTKDKDTQKWVKRKKFTFRQTAEGFFFWLFSSARRNESGKSNTKIRANWCLLFSMLLNLPDFSPFFRLYSIRIRNSAFAVWLRHDRKRVWTDVIVHVKKTIFVSFRSIRRGHRERKLRRKKRQPNVNLHIFRTDSLSLVVSFHIDRSVNFSHVQNRLVWIGLRVPQAK